MVSRPNYNFGRYPVFAGTQGTDNAGCKWIWSRPLLHSSGVYKEKQYHQKEGLPVLRPGSRERITNMSGLDTFTSWQIMQATCQSTRTS